MNDPEQYVVELHSYSPDAQTTRERWLYEIQADRLCDSDIGHMIAIESPVARMVKLLWVRRIDRTVFGMNDDQPVRLMALGTDDGEWVVRVDRRIWLQPDMEATRGSMIRWPILVTDDAMPLRWTTEKPS